MQRLARLTKQESDASAVALFSQYNELMLILLRHLPPSTASLFARPRENADYVEWYTDLEGQPYPLGSGEKDKPLASRINTLIAQRLQSIERLAEELKNNGKIQPAQAELLQKLVDATKQDTSQVYLINDEPVIIGWGMGKELPKPIIAPAVAPPLVAATSRRWCWWLLPLLLLLLGFLAWWFYFRPQMQLELVRAVKADIQYPQVAKLEPIMPKIELPKLILPPTETAKIEPQLPPPVVAETVNKAKECRTKVDPGKTPQMVIVFDNSASMFLTLAESPQTLKDFQQRWTNYGVTEAEINYMYRSPNRLGVAKKASASIINNISPNVEIGLVSLYRCPAATRLGRYSPSKRGALKAKINGMLPSREDSGTPLYSGLQQAAAMVDGKNRDAFILIISDGEDNCKSGDVCSLARQIAKQKPRLKINVVDIGGAKAANCIATATGGKVFTGNNQKQVANMINQAVKPMTKVNECE
ncbi:VWA domain-containing protein [Testudinibacter aquarius]|uniref:VWA domain-containing protein n=1 Tax=Testudinibacter aquarius TaxID=1524974 RepID=A0A4R3YD51_9PAST|nr:VWA domain-containing protein [Testudinibacter aquarius]KAE9527427.1 hypothetical protein A1D24_01960 [Testudinibacter aquarius]TCV89950.1 von Willebrand factor type A domain-containing protein [Testudinibacter aquarius]TNG92216.1 VWA domain-containing protein [Testudinibacter aquarius]